MKKNKSENAKADKAGPKKPKKRLRLGIAAIVCWALFGLLIRIIFGAPERETFTVKIFADTVSAGPFSVSVCTVWGLWVSLVIIILAAIFRIFCVPRFSKIPKGIQNVLELSISKIEDYTYSSAGKRIGGNLPAYIFTLALFLVGCAALELFDIRSPSSDILMTFALALVTFFLINFYGLKEKGFRGRLNDYIKPTPIMAPIKLITDIALPVSMACRLFGNMLAGLIIMELVYFALGSFAAGPPAILGLYFNVFHPLIQAFIFITLTLSFIGEAAEAQE